MGTIRATDGNTKIVIVDIGRCDRMVHPFVLRLIDIELGTERAFIRSALRTLVYDRALRAGEGQLFAVGLDKILANFRANKLEEKSEMGDDRIVATYGLAVLRVIDQTDQ